MRHALFLERVFPLGIPCSPLSFSSPPRACGSNRDPFRFFLPFLSCFIHASRILPFLSCDPSGSLVPLEKGVGLWLWSV